MNEASFCSPEPRNPERWVRPAGVAVDCWFDDEACLVFHAPSGQTHYLNRPAWELFERLDTTPRTAQALADDLLPGGAEPDAQATMLESVQQSLRILDHLGMIETASCA